jgi:hypothetical protein
MRGKLDSPALGSGTPVQATLNGSATVAGELVGKIIIEDGTGFRKIRDDLDRVIKLVGSLLAESHGRGPGSLGQSSPEANAPPRPYTGDAFGP